MALSGYKKHEQIQYKSGSKIYRGFVVASDAPKNATDVLVKCDTADQPFTSSELRALPMSAIAPDPDWRPRPVADNVPSQAAERDANLLAWFRMCAFPVPAPPREEPVVDKPKSNKCMLIEGYSGSQHNPGMRLRKSPNTLDFYCRVSSDQALEYVDNLDYPGQGIDYWNGQQVVRCQRIWRHVKTKVWKGFLPAECLRPI